MTTYLFIIIVFARGLGLVSRHVCVNMHYFQCLCVWTSTDGAWILMRGPSTPLSHDCWDWVALQRGTASQAEKEQRCACVQMQNPPSQQEKRAMCYVSVSYSCCSFNQASNENTLWIKHTGLFIHRNSIWTQFSFLWCSRDLDESNKAAFNFLYYTLTELGGGTWSSYLFQQSICINSCGHTTFQQPLPTEKAANHRLFCKTSCEALVVR